MMDKVFSGQMLQRFPVMIIHVSVLPHGAGVAISPPDQQPNTTVKLGLVYASPQCIGN
jgi:hypothetical protein